MLARWQPLLRALHRDLGYFFTGVVLVYAVSGLAINHVSDWDPDFVVERREVPVVLPHAGAEIDREAVTAALARIPDAASYQTFELPTSSRVKIYVDDGSITSTLGSGVGTYETVRRRPVLYQLNRLHVRPAGWWLAFSDVFAVALVVIAVTGLVLARGKHGLEQRGKWLVGAGVLIPLVALFLS